MSDERTEQPTSKKLEQFRNEGRVAKSQDLSGIVVLYVGVYMLAVIGPRLVENLSEIMRISYEEIGKQRPGLITYNYLLETGSQSLLEMGMIMAPWLGVLVAIGIGANVVQTRGLVQPKLLIPKWDRLNPLSRLKQMFGKQIVAETVKGLAKQSAIALVVYGTLSGRLGELINSARLGFDSGVSGSVTVAYDMSIQAAAVLMAIALLDYGWQFYQFRKSLLMSKQEVRDESKQQEGSPEVKSRIRRIQREMAQRRMMAQVPKADAIIVNPTHYAAAIRYDNKTMDAPRLVAKGHDEVALRIISLARKHGVPVVPNKPLARALYKLPLDTVIPPEFFQAVAEVLAFVYGLKRR